MEKQNQNQKQSSCVKSNVLDLFVHVVLPKIKEQVSQFIKTITGTAMFTITDVCKNDGRCTKAQSTFARPNGKALCRRDGRCTKAQCIFAHPNGKALCKHDGRCTNAQCPFAHPNGKAQFTEVTTTVGLAGNTLQTETMTVTKDEVVTSDIPTRPNYDFVFVLDVSGSMSGDPSKEMLQALSYLISSVLEPNDGVGIVTFSNAPSSILPITPKYKLSLEKDIKSALEGSGSDRRFRCGGGTALWDSIGTGLEMLATRPRIHPPFPSHPFLVVLTDGEDNHSTRLTASNTKDILEHPKSGGYRNMGNFHGSFLSVGASATVGAQFDVLVRDKPHLKHFNCASAESIKQMFFQVHRQICEVRRTTTTTITRTQSISNGLNSLVKGMHRFKGMRRARVSPETL
jgi:Mg-chelatase subunit ChlD